MGMAQCWTFALLLFLVAGCDGKSARMAQPEDPDGPYREQIAAARRLLEQKENWADRAEWEVLKSSQGWEIIAWRVEHPERKGADRYLPWGYSVIELDSRSVAVDYHRKG
jgi:hypothetical protein